jgi:hypothetical protein
MNIDWWGWDEVEQIPGKVGGGADANRDGD